MTESDREEAFRAREIALMKMEDRDFIGAQKIILKAQKRFPELDNVPQLLTICKVHCAAESRVSGVMDWYAILQAEAGADEAVIRKQYRKLAFSLHPDKNSFAGAEAAFKLVAEACSVLCDREKRSQYDLKMRKASRKAARPRQEPSNMNDANEGSETTFWTVCPRCETRYRYYSCVLNSRVRCQQCERNFFAKEHYVPTSSNSDISSEQGHPEQPSSPSSVDGGGSTDTSHSTDECPLTHATGPGVSDPTAEDWLRDATRLAERLRESPEETNQSVHVARTDTTDECTQCTVTDTWATGPHVSDSTVEGSDRLAERLREKPEEAKQSVHVARTQLAASIPIRPSLPREGDKTPRSDPSMAAAGDGEPMEVDPEIEVATVLCDLQRTLQARKRKRQRRGDASSWGRRRRWSVLQDGVPSDAGVAQRNGTASPDTPLAFRDSSVPEEPLNENRVKAPAPKKEKKSVPEVAAAKKAREQEQAREKADADAKKAREKAETDAKKAREKAEAAVRKAEAAAAEKARLKEEAAKKAREKAEAAVKRAEAAAAEKARLKEEAAAKKAREQEEAAAKKAREKAEAKAKKAKEKAESAAKKAREKAEAAAAKKAREQAEAAAKKAREQAAAAAAKKAREEAEAAAKKAREEAAVAAKKAREQAEADAKKAREEEEAEAEEDKAHQEWVQKQRAVIASLSQESTDLVKEIKAHKIRLLRLWYRNQSLKEKRKAWQQEQARKMWEEARKKQEEEARKIREKEEEARKTLERLEQARKARQQEEQERKMREQQKQARKTRRSQRLGTAVPDPEPDPKETTVPNPVPEPKEIDAEAREARRRRLEKLRAKTGTRRGGGG